MKWTFDQSIFSYEILMNDEIIHQAINPTPRTFRNVNGYLGTIWLDGEDPGSLFAAGKFRNFTFKSEAE